MINSEARTLRKPRSRDILDFINIRKASGIDDDDIGDLLLRTFTETYAEKLPNVIAPPSRLHELRDVKVRRESGEVVVLELGYRIIGTFALIRSDSSQSEAWLPHAATLRCVAIDPEFHGLGFSSLLLGEAERIARSWQARYICLHVQQGAHGVAKLYQDHGYLREPRGDFMAHGYTVEGYFLPLNEVRTPEASM